MSDPRRDALFNAIFAARLVRDGLIVFEYKNLIPQIEAQVDQVLAKRDAYAQVKAELESRAQTKEAGS